MLDPQNSRDDTPTSKIVYPSVVAIHGSQSKRSLKLSLLPVGIQDERRLMRDCFYMCSNVPTPTGRPAEKLSDRTHQQFRGMFLFVAGFFSRRYRSSDRVIVSMQADIQCMCLALSGSTVIEPAPLFPGVTVRTRLTCILSPPVPIVLSLTQRLVLQ